MSDAPPITGLPLSDRAQEILRRADAEMAAPSRIATTDVEDLGQLLDVVQAGLAAARAHVTTLGAALERIAEELERHGR